MDTILFIVGLNVLQQQFFDICYMLKGLNILLVPNICARKKSFGDNNINA